jgi:hypothetical protein
MISPLQQAALEFPDKLAGSPEPCIFFGSSLFSLLSARALAAIRFRQFTFANVPALVYPTGVCDPE